MAMAAWMRARELAPGANPTKLLGIGGTASLATDRPKRGAHRVHVALQSVSRTEVCSLALVKDTGNRAEEEAIAATLILARLGKACGAETATLLDHLPTGRGQELLSFDHKIALADRSELLTGQRKATVIRHGPAVEHCEMASLNQPVTLFPGAFNPPHEGHLRMATIAEAKTGQQVAWEISIRNVDKPPLDFIALEIRIAALGSSDNDRPILLTQAPTFREKAALAPGSTFVVGVDTVLRIANPKYYDNEAARDEGCAQFKAAGCRILVFGRVIDGQFQTLSDLTLPPALL